MVAGSNGGLQRAIPLFDKKPQNKLRQRRSPFSSGSFVTLLPSLLYPLEPTCSAPALFI